MNSFNLYLVWMGYGLFEHYMNLFPDDRLNILVSFAYLPGQMNLIKKYRHQINNVALDPGTYTLCKNKDSAPHATEENYRRYTKRYKNEFDVIFSYDADFSTAGFATNFPCQLRLEDAGVSVTPVVHNIEDDEIDKYLRRGHELISLGSAQITKPEHLDTVFGKLKNTTTKVHLLGKTDTKFLTRRPLSSADSSSYGHVVSVGIVLYWNDVRDADEFGDKTDKIYMGDLDHCGEDKHRGIHIDDYEYRADFEYYLQSQFGLSRNDLIGGEGNFNKQLVNMRYYSILEFEINRIYRHNGWVDDEGKLLPIE